MQQRHLTLVLSHLKPNQKLAAAAKIPSFEKNTLAATQAIWRFLANKKVTISKLMEPLLALSLDGIEQYCAEYALVVHDWSGLQYSKHHGKTDKKELHNKYELGYELQTSLALSDRTGLPIGVLVQNVTHCTGVLSSYQGDVTQPELSHLKELSARVKWIGKQAIKQKKVHIVDREGDAVEWLRANEDELWLIRCRKNSTVTYQEKSYQVQELAELLSFSENATEILFQGKKAYQTVAYADVTLARPAQPKPKKGEKAVKIPGKSLAARYVVTKVLNEQGECVAQWHLLTNVLTNDVSPEKIALWYYWRWKIECFFKLLKQQGLQAEDWQQESALAITKRLMIATQACVFVWQLQHDDSSESIETQKFLVRLSGRQMKKSHPITPSALLEGLWFFLASMSLLESYTFKQLRIFKQRLQI